MDHFIYYIFIYTSYTNYMIYGTLTLMLITSACIFLKRGGAETSMAEQVGF